MLSDGKKTGVARGGGGEVRRRAAPNPVALPSWRRPIHRIPTAGQGRGQAPR